MNVSDMEVELKRALAHQAQTSAALGEAVRDKLTAEADLKKAMVRYRPSNMLSWLPGCHTAHIHVLAFSQARPTW
jgi:hypothetical protein